MFKISSKIAYESIHKNVFPKTYLFNLLYLLFVIFIIYLQSSTKVFSTTGTSHWMTGSSFKSITGLFLWINGPERCTWFPDILSFFFLTSLLVFLNSYILLVLFHLYPSPSLNWVAKLLLNWGTVPHMEIVKWCIPETFFGHGHTTEFIDSFRNCVSLTPVLTHYKATYYIHSFSLLYRNFMFFLHSLQMINIWNRWKNVL